LLWLEPWALLALIFYAILYILNSRRSTLLPLFGGGGGGFYGLFNGAACDSYAYDGSGILSSKAEPPDAPVGCLDELILF